MGSQGGPGNEPKKPEGGIPISLSVGGNQIFAVAAVIAMQVCMKMIVWPDRFKIDQTDARARLEALIKELLREIKNMPTEGTADADELAGKETMIRIVEQIAGALRDEIARS
jgi:hypothetical protein